MTTLTTVPLGPAYARLWTATALSNVGDGIRAAALPLLAAAWAGTPALVAGVAVAGQLPWLLIGLVAGAVVDRVDRRRLVAVVDIGRAVLLAALVAAVASGRADVWLLYAVAFASGLGETLRDTAASTLVPPLVPEEALERANGRLLTAEVTGNELVGPVLGSWLFVVAAMLPFAVNGSTLVVAAMLVLTLPDLYRPAPAVWPDGARRASVRADVAEGLRWLVRHRLLRLVTGLVALLALLDAAWFAVLVLYAGQIGIGEAGFGLLLAMGALGGVAGGLLADRIIGRLSLTGALAAGVVLTGTAQLALGLSDVVAVIGTGLAVSGFAFALANVAVVSLRQRATPTHLLGRVTATYRTLAIGASALGALLGGLVADDFGVRAPMLAGAPVLIAAGALAAPMLRRLAKETT